MTDNLEDLYAAMLVEGLVRNRPEFFRYCGLQGNYDEPQAGGFPALALITCFGALEKGGHKELARLAFDVLAAKSRATRAAD